MYTWTFEFLRLSFRYGKPGTQMSGTNSFRCPDWILKYFLTGTQTLDPVYHCSFNAWKQELMFCVFDWYSLKAWKTAKNTALFEYNTDFSKNWKNGTFGCTGFHNFVPHNWWKSKFFVLIPKIAACFDLTHSPGFQKSDFVIYICIINTIHESFNSKCATPLITYGSD